MTAEMHMGRNFSSELVTHNGTHRTSDCPSCQYGWPSRRRFMATAGAWSAMATLPEAIALAQTTSNLVDTHHHFYPPDYQKAWIDWEDARKVPHFPTQVAWARAKTVEEMDKNGITTAILSIASTPGVWFDSGPEAASRMVRACNEYAVDMMREYPGRFGLFATLSMLDIEVTLKEIEYALDVLKADGIGLQTNYGDKWLGHQDFRPELEELNRRKTVVYWHPLASAC